MKRRFTLVSAEEEIPQTEEDMKEQLKIFTNALQNPLLSPPDDDEDDDAAATAADGTHG